MIVCHRNWSRKLMILAGAALLAALPVCAQSDAYSTPTAGPVGWTTNGPAVFRLLRVLMTNTLPIPPAWTNPAFAKLREQRARQVTVLTNQVFEMFQPDSLNHLVWTNLVASTNGRGTTVWWERTHPTDWPTNPPVVKWNPGCLLFGWRGYTAISPCWEGEVWNGQVPITALTRRHGYSRGHGMGTDGFSTNYVGRKVWFVSGKNELVTVKVVRQVVRIGGTPRRDYTIFLFDRDLPARIEPMGVAQIADVLEKYGYAPGAPMPFFKTEQGGNVSAEIAGFSVPTWKGGDSGSPDMLPLPGELVFVGGRSTTGPTPSMQSDMDELCRQQGLDPKNYQMRWVDLSRFPAYGARKP